MACSCAVEKNVVLLETLAVLVGSLIDVFGRPRSLQMSTEIIEQNFTFFIILIYFQ